MYKNLINIIEDIVFNEDLIYIDKVHYIICLISFANKWFKDEN